MHWTTRLRKTIRAEAGNNRSDQRHILAITEMPPKTEKSSLKRRGRVCSKCWHCVPQALLICVAGQYRGRPRHQEASSVGATVLPVAARCKQYSSQGSIPSVSSHKSRVHCNRGWQGADPIPKPTPAQPVSTEYPSLLLAATLVTSPGHSIPIAVRIPAQERRAGA